MLYRLMSISEYVQMNHNTLPINTTIWSKYHESSNHGYCLFDDAEVKPETAIELLHTRYSIIVYFSEDKANLYQAHGVYHVDRDTEVFLREYGCADLCQLHPVRAHRIIGGRMIQEGVDLYA